MPNKKNKRMPAQSTTTVQDCLFDLHLIVMQFLKAVKARRSLVGQIERATTSAVLAFEQATVGLRPRYQLRRTRAALAVCHRGFKMLCFESSVGTRVFDEVRRRVEQLRSVFEELERTPAEDWQMVSIPPLRSASLDDKEDRTLVELQRTSARVAAVMREVGEVVPPPNGPAVPAVPAANRKRTRAKYPLPRDGHLGLRHARTIRRDSRLALARRRSGTG
jgi:hypothetical protein